MENSCKKMIDEALKIYVDHLKQGKVEKIDRVLSPTFIEVEEPHLSFHSDVMLHGEAYITEGGLVIHFDVKTEGQIPCTICNEPVKVPIAVKGFYHVEPFYKTRRMKIGKR